MFIIVKQRGENRAILIKRMIKINTKKRYRVSKLSTTVISIQVAFSLCYNRRT